MLISEIVLDDKTEYLLDPKVGDVVILVKGDRKFWNERGLMDKFENTIQVVSKIEKDYSGIRVFFKDGGECDSDLRDPEILNSWYWRPARKCMISVGKYRVNLSVKLKLKS